MAADFQHNDGIACSRHIQEHMKILFDLGVSVFIFKNHFISSCGLQFVGLAVNVLLAEVLELLLALENGGLDKVPGQAESAVQTL